MLRWALVFFIVALVAVIFGFLGIAAAAAGIAKLLFFIFLVLFLISLGGVSAASLRKRAPGWRARGLGVAAILGGETR